MLELAPLPPHLPPWPALSLSPFSLSRSWAWGPVKVPGHINPPNSLTGLWGVKDEHIASKDLSHVISLSVSLPPFPGHRGRLRPPGFKPTRMFFFFSLSLSPALSRSCSRSLSFSLSLSRSFSLSLFLSFSLSLFLSFSLSFFLYFFLSLSLSLFRSLARSLSLSLSLSVSLSLSSLSLGQE